ncbi:NYN domain-containing protein [Sphaerotilus mobilis]|uniref:OST-HTH/LOTUS domain-containing protein n=1 Tax=Sphaerotilus mobilis TaxID=47994 RepID=A0A4Q7LCQ2_9BURK|nr:NYN domain-containing protein [Sphaerotilus mobilis]RZS47490.1 OST-HTH/LOTUS domain-containing protein [Sphaerotilus mobilis]
MPNAPESVALYWDFENLHASLVDQRYGQGAYFSSRFRPQEALIDVAAIVEFALSLGPVAVNRAFANWASFSRYRYALLEQAVELIQLFQPGSNGKNGADIRLCLDVVEDMGRFPHIGTIVVVGGDSDFMPLSFKVKAAGRTLVGIGALNSTNANWARSCHEFKYYEAMLRPLNLRLPAHPDDEPAAHADPRGAAAAGAMLAERAARADAVAGESPARATAGDEAAESAEGVASMDDHMDDRTGDREADREGDRLDGGAAAPADVADAASAELSPVDLELRSLLDRAAQAQERHRDARELVRRAIDLLSQRRGDAWVQKAGVRPVIQRMDPTFQESSYGCANFSELLQAMPDLVEVRKGEFDHEIRLKPID